MNYKETLFFIGKCLTITHEKDNRILVEKQLKTGTVNWDNIVKITTAHYVFPALYCNLKRADFLHYLPEDLVEYMKHITDLNRERNQQIIKEAKEINTLLLAHNITPIFLKGTGNLLDGLYQDIAERMVGDADILVNKKDCIPAFKILQENGYTNKVSELFNDHRHLPRITHPKKIAAVEIHKEMLREEKSDFFNYESIKNSLKINNNVSVLSFKNQIKLTVFSKLINDDAFMIKNISLRGAYDVFLLGNKLQTKIIIEDTHLSSELNAGLILYTTLLACPKNISFIASEENKKFLNKAIKALDINRTNSFKRKITLLYLRLKTRLTILIKALFSKSYFLFVFSKITDINWIKEKIGISKSTP
ncbi:nucleotidyltransferase family protein [Tenacibaculum finnmarkense]|uniref:nucleotidyltransferase family protein n=1 Tax=Tenacibaculum finnmarkense TaxID=2781243 RepID=UPI000C4AE9A2|nr:nucleotidyltransferase family protein [Tenacibaculum finnmarkense]MCD8440292.1 nucleotidyltransferase family protein [Tenacibaculum finnmarkense genomovar ulcerans]MCG8721122.1 nucleotidyltransferase family protein [Tenacibaculum finnmarkense]MCG8762673.1 nucleotidyltransferase family protein [Tenacibaculum finnmarkense]MCG8788005.1 nucleotidyltransferase family protein [Tenacibaculum finnmarkense]SOS54664.1 conserved hypothetical protein [Tenacibaculum finnmarkense]